MVPSISVSSRVNFARIHVQSFSPGFFRGWMLDCLFPKEALLWLIVICVRF